MNRLEVAVIIGSLLGLIIFNIANAQDYSTYQPSIHELSSQHHQLVIERQQRQLLHQQYIQTHQLEQIHRNTDRNLNQLNTDFHQSPFKRY